MQEYQYEALNTQRNEIRILNLLPGKFDDRLSVILTRQELLPRANYSSGSSSSRLPPHYEALSYVWGSQEDKVQLSVRTAKIGEADALLKSPAATADFQCLYITRNLHRALPFLRYEHEPRELWIDAICVNQNDLVERSQQVQRMADVYSLASQVIV